MNDSNYLNSRVCSEVLKWYLSHDKTSESDVVNIGGCISLKTSTMVLLIGAGGVCVAFYLWNRETYSPNDEESRLSIYNWLFDGELVKGGTKEPATAKLKPSLNEGVKERNLNLNGEDSSLNCIISRKIQDKCPKKFLKYPLFDVNQNRRSRSPFHISNPCPACVKGTCRIKQHQRPIVSPYPRISLHEAFSKGNTPPVASSKHGYRPIAKLYGNATRGAPDGRERWSVPPSKDGDIIPSGYDRMMCSDSMESLAMSQCSINGSMIDLVNNAKEARRLIRAASVDSTLSDMSIGFDFGDLERDSKLNDKCGTESEPVSFYLYEDNAESCPLTEDEILPDLNALQKSLQFNKTTWMLTNFNGRSRQTSVLSDISQLERESSCASFDQWEWDNDCCFEEENGSNEYIDPDQLEHFMEKYSWLQDTEHKYQNKNIEYDPKNLYNNRLSTSPLSKHSSIDREMALGERRPPSGRSSEESDYESSSSLSSPKRMTIKCGSFTTMDTTIQINIEPRRPHAESPYCGDNQGCSSTLLTEHQHQQYNHRECQDVPAPQWGKHYQ